MQRALHASYWQLSYLLELCEFELLEDELDPAELGDCVVDLAANMSNKMRDPHAGAMHAYMLRSLYTKQFIALTQYFLYLPSQHVEASRTTRQNRKILTFL